jgi:hypothetical protein
MNERIRELAEQVVGPARLHGGDFALMGNEQVKKFAELIVGECISVLNRRFMGDLNREDWEVRRCVADVKKHFGVE